MATATATQPMSKSARKKAAKAIERTDSPAPSTTSVAASADKADDSFESPYIKELQKNIRNVNKKIVNANKTDSLLAEHKGKTLDELVAAKILNTDQKAQILKKPGLQAQLVTLEEQLAQYQRVHDQYTAQAASEKAEFENRLQKAKEDASAEAKEASDKSLQDNLLLLSQFLRLAAHSRGESQNPEADENQAIEGVLLAIYSGDSSAVAAMIKLIQGSGEQVISVAGEKLESTYSDIGALAKGHIVAGHAEPAEAEAEEDSDVTVAEPTIAEPTVAEPTVAEPTVAEPNVAEIEAAAESLTVTEAAPTGLANGNDLSISQEWVDVQAPQDAAPATEAPAEVPGAQSWADDQPEAGSGTAPPNDGFHQVQRNRVRHEREGSGNFRGRGRGDYRGRGRGDGRGRGRGNNRNTSTGGAAPRPARREDQ
ncbi:hypothetical protein ISF_05069 [Cordyceps fumosorosea ARSEF 2679]|uniref:YAG7-like dimerisation domain-containing protein n=1 Tax=Cordyceps fumosorosea (strain ARSEF 2679) TaxID=1081104 RepID=A0A167W0S9_CORFA|nr:hypothetical protein ISF_05069 [Cordyceps fumosorosea ARSEF 2679]OAA63193.1 hypothetical protein ISF_05069 [Cordyceps fumosorosea ARSEF 2679]